MLPIFMRRLANYVDAAATTSNGQLASSRKVLKGVHFNDASGGTAGTVVLKDGGSSGTIRLTINTPGQGSGEDVQIPGGGIVFENDIYVELTNVDAITIFHADR